ncbi:MAG: mechanosensitive ion channel family protein [bacterium]|nr:mechanosensitive ion channel family protein [bacterium]
MEKICADYLNKFFQYLPRIPIALAIIVAGWLLGRLWNNFYLRISKNSKIDPLARKYIGRLVYIAVFVLAIIVSLSTLGLNITPFLAGIGAGGLIVGFGVRETVADFAAGLMIFMYRPFKIGDFVKIGGVEGEIVNISPVNIELKAKDNRKILVPNRSAWGQVIYNSTRDGKNMIALQIVVDSSAQGVEESIKEVFQSHNARYICCLTTVSQTSLTFTIYSEIPKEGIFESESMIKDLWQHLREKNINATITLVS